MKILTIILSLLLVTTTGMAQRRGRKPQAPVITITPQEAMEKYDFAKAEEVLEQQIAYYEQIGQSTEELEQQLEMARTCRIKLQATEQVIFIDSIVTGKASLLDCIKLSDESGTLSYLSDARDSLMRIVFENQLGNKKLVADTDANNHIKLYEQLMEGGKWSTPQLCKGLNEEPSDDVNFPFMLNDGLTLYFAARSDEGIGGYDLFMTRYDTDERAFLSPENIGMPFNSPANDYLLVIDEYYNIGYLVSDRNQPADSVCIYVFIPNTTRKVYNVDEIGAQRLSNLARINSIRDTWGNKEVVTQAKQRFEQLCKGTADAQKAHDFDFVINDARTYTTLSDFKNKNALLKANFWIETSRDIAQTSKDLNNLRNQYSSAGNDKRQQIAPQIRLMESNLEKMINERIALEKEIRKLELGQ